MLLKFIIYDNETKTYYLQARYYNPEIQRVISEDTYRGELEDPLSLNLYTYCANNPMIYTDESGHIPVPLITALALGIFNFGTSIIGDILSGQDINWLNAGGAFVEGAIVGGTLGVAAPLGLGLAGTLGGGIVGGTIGNSANQLITTGKLDWNKATNSGLSTAVGALAFGVGGNVTSTGFKKVASYALKGFNAGGYADLTNRALTKGIFNIDPMEVLASGTLGAVISPIAAKVGEMVINKFGNTKTNVVEEINLKYREGWTENQKLAADAKVKALSESETIKTVVERQNTSASTIFKEINGKNSVPIGSDVDHIIDSQLGGAEKSILNMSPLDSSVNRSLGIQIHNEIKNYPYGTIFKRFTIK